MAIFPVMDEESCTKAKLLLFGTGKEFIGEMGKLYYLLVLAVFLTLSVPECLMEFCKVSLTFRFADEIL